MPRYQAFSYKADGQLDTPRPITWNPSIINQRIFPSSGTENGNSIYNVNLHPNTCETNRNTILHLISRSDVLDYRWNFREVKQPRLGIVVCNGRRSSLDCERSIAMSTRFTLVRRLANLNGGGIKTAFTARPWGGLFRNSFANSLGISFAAPTFYVSRVYVRISDVCDWHDGGGSSGLMWAAFLRGSFDDQPVTLFNSSIQMASLAGDS